MHFQQYLSEATKVLESMTGEQETKQKSGKKYEFTGETAILLGKTLYQIRALKSFSKVKEGDLGGWIESENNLSHKGDCWIYGDDSYVLENAKVFNNASIDGKVIIKGNAKVYDNVILDGNESDFQIIIEDNALVYGDSKLYGAARVRNNARVYGNAKISDSGDIFDKAKVYGNSEVYGLAKVSGESEVFENANVHGYASIKGKAKVYGNSDIAGHARLGGNYKAKDEVIKGGLHK